jgi:hypothetical protein
LLTLATQLKSAMLMVGSLSRDVAGTHFVQLANHFIIELVHSTNEQNQQMRNATKEHIYERHVLLALCRKLQTKQRS